ncbi:acetolactate synthase small subunit [uncultured Eubacterium sp.]|uniref:acetolactate synthase small subunit n=1 Tax=uncultured Eubacterium sp. TaxID=165185 RepID=UPI0026719AEB|nr:acetolactate synthase small subunit [uncultured Eubacterium sp.]
MNKKVLSVLVDNTSGVLNRIAGLFSRRGYNIDSLTVGETENPKYSRMTIVVTGDDAILEQIIKQITKLEDVRRVDVLESNNSVTRELILVKIKTDAAQRQQVMAMTEIFRANIVDVAKDSVMIEITGSQSKLSAFLSLLEDYEILELVRTGITGLSRGKK